MNSRQRVRAALAHECPDRLPIDMGSTSVTGMHVSCVAALREYYGLDRHPVKVIETPQMLGEIEEDLKQVLGIDVEGIPPRKASFGIPMNATKPWRMYDGLEVLMPAGFEFTIDSNGDTLVYPQGDRTAAPSARMPAGGYFFDVIVRQQPIDEDRLDPADNVEEFSLLSPEDVAYFEAEARRASETGRAVVGKFSSGLGDIAAVPGMALKKPKGIRDITEWYMSIKSRPDYIREVLWRQSEAILENLRRVHGACAGTVDVAYICGTDFGTQKSTFCSPETFKDLWFPCYKRINDWIHQNTSWKTFKHCCGSVVKLLDLFIDAGFDILNPVQISAAGMDPEYLKSTWGDRLVFWGGGVDTQHVLAFGTPAEVREQVLRNCEVFARGGGYVFNTVHNVQARTPVQNIVSMFQAIREFSGAA